MKSRSKGTYEIAGRDLIAEGVDMRVSTITLDPGQYVPWHYHTEIDDHFICLRGEITVTIKSPDATHKLRPGERTKAPKGTHHHVSGSNSEQSEFMIIQGIGVYDYVEV